MERYDSYTYNKLDKMSYESYNPPFWPREWEKEGKTDFFSSLEELQKHYPIHSMKEECLKTKKKYNNRYYYTFRTSECIMYCYDGEKWWGIIKYTYSDQNKEKYFAEYWYIKNYKS